MPFRRVLIRDGQLHFTQWRPALSVWPSEKAMYADLASKGATLADVSRECVDGVREMFVLPVADHQLSSHAVELLVEHARSTGYHRIWVGAGLGVFDLPGLVPFGSEATVACSMCGWIGVESTPEFWTVVARHNEFPQSCIACGHSIPAWTVAESSGQGSEAAPSDLFETEWDSIAESHEERANDAQHRGDND